MGLMLISFFIPPTGSSFIVSSSVGDRGNFLHGVINCNISPACRGVYVAPAAGHYTSVAPWPRSSLLLGQYPRLGNSFFCNL